MVSITGVPNVEPRRLRRAVRAGINSGERQSEQRVDKLPNDFRHTIHLLLRQKVRTPCQWASLPWFESLKLLASFPGRASLPVK